MAFLQYDLHTEFHLQDLSEEVGVEKKLPTNILDACF